MIADSRGEPVGRRSATSHQRAVRAHSPNRPALAGGRPGGAALESTMVRAELDPAVGSEFGRRRPAPAAVAQGHGRDGLRVDPRAALFFFEGSVGPEPRQVGNLGLTGRMGEPLQLCASEAGWVRAP